MFAERKRADCAAAETSSVDLRMCDPTAVSAVEGLQQTDIAWVLKITRVSALLMLASFIALGLGDFEIYRAVAPKALAAMYALELLVVAAVTALTFTRWMEAHWRAILLGVLTLVIAINVVISGLEAEPDFLFLGIAIFVVATGALLPWSTRWQVAFGTVGLIALGAYSVWASGPDPMLVFHWTLALAGIFLGYFAALLGARHRAERRQQVEALEQSEEKFRHIFEKSVDALMITSLATGKLIDVNEQFVASTGIARRDAIGKTTAELELWNDPDLRARFLAELQEKGEVRDLEAEFKIKGGQLAPGLISASVGTIAGAPCVIVVVRDISKLKQAERAIRESEATFRQVFEASVDAIAITDTKTRKYVDVNAEFARTTGYHREDLVGRTSEDINRWARAEQRTEYRRRLAERSPLRNFEAEFRLKDGSVKPYLLSAVVAPIGGRQCTITIERDISDRKEAERQLKESEATLRRILDSALDAISVNDMSDGTYVYVNRAFAMRTGMSAEQVIGKPTYEINVWAHLDQFFEFTRRLVADGEVESMEIAFRGKDGRVVPNLLSGTVVEIGGRRCAVTLARDISERKEAERKLEQSEATLRHILDSIADPVTLNDLATGRYVYVNGEFLRRTGFRAEDVLGKRVRDFGFWPDHTRTEYRAFARRILAGTPVRSMEVELRGRQGRKVPSLISATTVEVGGRPCVLSITRDISALKEIQRELEAAREAALSASRAKSEFLSSMSHEIRTPMNAILGMAELLGETELDLEQRRYLDTIASNGDALLQLINGILDLAKVESGRLSLESTEFDVVDLVEKVAETLAVRAHEKQIELAVRFASVVPRMLVGDPLRLRQVLTNLIGNAIKFTEQGEIVVSVACEAGASPPASLLFSVADTGIGIPQSKLASVFSAFTQADSSVTRKYGGSGLGLAIVERLVHLMGGRVWAESELGKGSTFHFTAQLALPDASRPKAPAPSVDLSGLRILIVDDNRTNREILRECLAIKGAVASEAESGAEGLKAIAEARRAGRPFGLLLVDCLMPEMDGFEMVKRVRLAPGGNDLIIMMISSNDLVVTMSHLKELGLNRYLMKPIKPRELYAAINETIAEAARHEVLDQPGPQRRAEPATRKEPEVPETTMRILLADDSADNRLLIRAYLKNTPYQLDEAFNGQEALAKVQSERYDLVLMDIQMPVLDGYRATRAIRQWEIENHRPRTSIIALTASALQDDVRRAEEAGCDLHVSKPVRKATLLDVIARAVAQSKTVKAADGDSGQTGYAVVEIDAELADLIPRFVKRKRDEATQILEAAGKGDFGALSAFGHKLKGEGGSYGFNRVGELGAALEQAAANRDAKKASYLATQLQSYLSRVKIVYGPAPR